MRFSPIIRKLLKRLSIRYYVSSCVRTLATVSMSAAAALILVALPTAHAEAPSSPQSIQPTLDRLNKEPGSAYSLQEASESDENAICIYEVAEDGSLTPRYYLVVLKEELFTADRDLQWAWQRSDSGMALVPTESADADITYTAQANEKGQYITFNPGITTFGNPSGNPSDDPVKTFYWNWYEFGTAEKNDDYIDPDKSTPVRGEIGAPEYMWLLKEATDTQDPATTAVIEYHYTDEDIQSRRTILASESAADHVEGVFTDLKAREENTLGAISADTSIKYVAKGGAIDNAGSIDKGISADFVGNSVSNLLIVDGLIGKRLTDMYIDITTVSMGGAIYYDVSSSRTQGAIQGNFIGNYVYTFFRDRGTEGAPHLGIDLRGKGGAIYHGIEVPNAGISAYTATLAGISGNFIGNYVKGVVDESGESGAYDTRNTYNLGGAIYNGIEGINMNCQDIYIGIKSISGTFVGNYVYNDHFTMLFGGSSIPSYNTFYTFGGAIYNGIIGISNSGENTFKTCIGAIDGNFIGNFVYDVNPFKRGAGRYNDDPALGDTNIDGMGGWCDRRTEKRQRALGGAIYNGIVDVKEDDASNIIADIVDIRGSFTGNYAYSKNYNTINQDDKISIHSFYALGGAIYNGLVGVQKAQGTYTSSIGNIGADFNGNYAYVVKASAFEPLNSADLAFGGAVYNGIADVDEASATITSSTGIITGSFADNYAFVYTGNRRARSSAFGGAIYNGVKGVIGSDGNITSSITNIGDSLFSGNLAETKNSTTGQLDSTKRNIARGGAVYNGIDSIDQSSAVINTEIEQGIGGHFADNKTVVTSYTTAAGGGVSLAAVQLQYALGGAVYNGIGSIVNSSGSHTSYIAGITGSFTYNTAIADKIGGDSLTGRTKYATKERYYAQGGALYNGVGIIQGGETEIQSSIGDIVADFIGNKSLADESEYVEWYSTSTSTSPNITERVFIVSGGAIYNAIRDVEDVNEGNIKSSLGSVYGDFIDNAACVEKKPTPNMRLGVSVGLSTTNRHISSTEVLNNATGGAVYNGIESVSGGTIELKSSIDFFYGDFINNKAAITGDISDYFYYLDSRNTSVASSNVTYRDITVFEALGTTNEAKGGAIYNGVASVTNNSGYIESGIKGLEGDFSCNSADVEYTRKIKTEYDDGRTVTVTAGEISDINIDKNLIYEHSPKYANTAQGGAVYNGVASVSKGDVSTIIGDIHGNFTGNSSKIEGNIAWNAIVNDHSSTTKGGVSISPVVSHNITLKDMAVITNSVAGGAIYNGLSSIDKSGGKMIASMGNITGHFVDNIARVMNTYTRTENIIDKRNIAESSPLLDKLNVTCDDSTSITTIAMGGAIYNGIAGGDGQDSSKAHITSISGNFTNNHAIVQSEITKEIIISSESKNDLPENTAPVTIEEKSSISSYAMGGAIYNGIAGGDGQDTSKAHITSISGDFSGNTAECKMAITNQLELNGVRSDLESDTVITDYAFGGAIYNGAGDGACNMNATIGSITGSFIDNHASSTGGEAKGGAIYNSGQIGEISSAALQGGAAGGFTGNSASTSGGAIYNAGTIAGISDALFSRNEAAEEGSALTNVGSIGEIAEDAASAREFDNTLIGGLINTGFIGNKSATADRAAALYTETSLAIIARGESEIVFKENAVGNDGLTRDIYVAANADGEMPDIYMVAEQGSSITTHGEINGDAGYTLRLRGFTERKDDTLSTHASGGVVDFEGLVMHADIIMDDVTLKIGLAKDAALEPTVVHDDAATRPKDGHELHPGEVEFSGVGGEVSGETVSFDRAYSDVLRSSRLEARSGRVQPGDSGVANYNIGTIISYGKASYHVADSAYYTGTADALYASWAVNLDMGKQKATTYTTWVREGNPTDSSRGYITLSSLNFLGVSDTHSVTGPEDATYDYPYMDVTVQIINLIRQDATGAAVDIPTEWTQAGDITVGAPLQLDLGELSQKKEATAYMSSRDILCDGIDYGTTKTWHDSLRIWGWRDNLAAWAELQLKNKNISDSENEKEFYIIDTHTLTRNLRRVDGRLLQQDTLKLYGDGIGASTLDVCEKNLLKEIAPGQSVELKDMSIIRVGENSILNEGRLIMDTLKVEPELTVHNESELIKRGVWDIENTFTSAHPETNSMVFDAATTTIYGTIEHQNIYHENASVTALSANAEADKRDAVWGGEETAPFRAFRDNALTMNSGTFYLHNLNSSELHLRGLSISGGNIVVNSVTVDLSDKHMGMIWADDPARATYDPAKGGHIEVKNLVLLPKDGLKSELRIPVQFVNPELGDSVVPFGEEEGERISNAAVDTDGHRVSKTYGDQLGQVYVYKVHYDYTMGQYVYELELEDTPGGGGTGDPDKPVINPTVKASPAASLAGGVASLMQVNEYVFEHADLFSAHVYSAQKERLRERSFTIVTPTKGKNAVAAAEPKAGCSYKAGFKGGMWVRPYAGYEKLPLGGGPRVTNSLYGALVGGDTALKEHKNGWSSVFSVHAAYMGSTQRYTERGAHVRINQNGGGVGATGTFYYKNFYTALTGTVATSTGHANSPQGTENFRTVMGGVASRSGYNIEFGKGRYVLQPTLLISYTSIHMPDYTNAAGARITADPLNVLQLHPYVKFIMNTDSCWVPYATVGYVQNIVGETRYQANGIRLPEMSIDPYVEYTLGIQRTWYDKYTIFGQATGRHGGRNGVEFSTGLRCAW